MNPSATSFQNPNQRGVARTAIAWAAAGILFGATACSSSDDSSSASTPTLVSTTQVIPPTGTATPTATPPTATPPTTTPPTTSTNPPPPTTIVDAERLAMVTGILDAHHTAGDFVGARLALLDPDGTITQATAGTTTNDPDSAPVDRDIAWNIGSVTKTFVAVVVLQLAQEGRLDLDAGIDSYMPELVGADRITPRELLQHTSGLNEYNGDPALLADDQREWTPAEMIAVAEAAGRVDEPGGAHHYSNTNYIVLGEIIEKITGQTWVDEVHTRIVEPLGMTNTGMLSDPLPVGYQVVDGSFVDSTSGQDPSLGGAAGGLQSTDHDLLLFIAALADGTLLSPAVSDQMQTFIPGEDYSQFGIDHGYGLGIETYGTDGMVVIGHMGTGEAQSAFIGYDPAHGTAVAVMTNTAVAGPQALMAVEALTAASQPR